MNWLKVTLIYKNGTSVSANCVSISLSRENGIVCPCDSCTVSKLYNTMKTNDNMYCPISLDGKGMFCDDYVLEDVDKIMEEI